MPKIKEAIEDYKPDPRLVDERGPELSVIDLSDADPTDPAVVDVAIRQNEKVKRDREEKKREKLIKLVVSANERRDGKGQLIGANGYTALKHDEPIIGRLIRNERIGSEELMAIEEIEAVHNYLCSGLFLRGYELRERLDRSHPTTPTWFIDAYERYKPWANEWSKRRISHNDKTLEVVFDILFSSRSGKEIDGEHCWQHGTAIRVFVNGVRDYAAAAGWVNRDTGRAWQAVARSVFPMRRMRTKPAGVPLRKVL